jgi:hypothetical protein
MGTISSDSFVVLASFDTLRAENIVQIGATGAVASPLFNRDKHAVLNLNVLITQSRMMKDAKDIPENLINGNSGMLPGIDNARYDILQHL